MFSKIHKIAVSLICFSMLIICLPTTSMAVDGTTKSSVPIKLEGTSPEDGSYNIPLDIEEFWIKFDQKMDIESFDQLHLVLADWSCGEARACWSWDTEISYLRKKGLLDIEFEDDGKKISLKTQSFNLYYGHHYSIKLVGGPIIDANNVEYSSITTKTDSGWQIYDLIEQGYEFKFCTEIGIKPTLTILDENDEEAFKDIDGVYIVKPGKEFMVKLEIKEKNQGIVDVKNVYIESGQGRLEDFGIREIGHSESIDKEIAIYEWQYESDPVITRRAALELHAKYDVEPIAVACLNNTSPTASAKVKFLETGLSAQASLGKQWDYNSQGFKEERDIIANKISYGPEFTVRMTITNTGDMEIGNLAPKFNIIPQNEHIIPVSEYPFEKLRPGESRDYISSYKAQAGSEGNYTIQGIVDWTNPIDGKEHEARSNELELIIQKPAKLSIEQIQFWNSKEVRLTNEIIVSTGQSFYAFVAVKNGDDDMTADANDVKVTIKGAGKEETRVIDKIEGGKVISNLAISFTVPIEPTKEGFTFSVSGFDSNSGKFIETTPISKDKEIEIQRKADLVIDSVDVSKQDENWLKQITINEGQFFRALVNVKNIGEADANNVNVEMKINGNIVKSSNFQSIKGGGGSWYFLTDFYQAVEKTGNLPILIEAFGEDNNSGAKISAKPYESDDAVIVQKPAKLEINSIEFNKKIGDEWLQNIAISEGKPFNIRVTVENSGEAGADILNVKINGISTSIPPESQIIPGEGKIQLVLESYTPNRGETGSLSFLIEVTGKDRNSGDAITPNATFGGVTVQKKANLVIESIDFSKQDNNWQKQITINEGQSFGIRITVKNDSEADADADVLELKINGKPMSISPELVPGNDSRPFIIESYTPNRGETGPLSLLIEVTGKDKNSGDPIIADPEAFEGVTVQKKANLVIESIEFSKGQENNWQKQITISEGQSFKIRVTIKNDGEASAEDVTPEVNLNENPIAVTPESQAIFGSSSGLFVSESHATKIGDAGKLLFSVEASGKDGNSGDVVIAPPKTTYGVIIQGKAKLAIDSVDFSKQGNNWANQITISEGQSFDIRVTMRNESDADGSVLEIKINDKSMSVPPNSQVIPGESNNNPFIFNSYTPKAGETGPLSFLIEATGKDTSSGDDIIIPAKTFAGVTVQKKASLVIESIEFSRGQENNWQKQITISEGQSFKVRVTVKNEGEAEAANVSVGIKMNATSTIASSTSQPITGGGRVQFISESYTTKTGDAGKPTFSITASGGGGISAPAATFDGVTIQKRASLAIEPVKFNKASENDWSESITVNEGQSFRIRVTVNNEGGADADNVSVELKLNGSIINVTPAFQTISGGGNGQFDSDSYIPKEGEAGELSFSITASGKDKNSQDSLVKTTNSTVTVQRKAELAINSIQFRKTAAESWNDTLDDVEIGELFHIRVEAENKGQAGAEKVYIDLISGEDTQISVPQDIAGGENAYSEFEYTISESSGVSSLRFTAIARGKDINSGLDVISEGFTSKAVTFLIDIEVKLQLEKAEYKDENEIGKVDKGDKVTLTFSEINTADLVPEDFSLLPEGTFGKSPTISASDNQIVITLGENPVLAGARKINIREAIFDIPIDEEIAPEIKAKIGQVKDSKSDVYYTSPKPVIFLLLKDYPIGFNNGIDLENGIKILDAQEQPKKFQWQLVPNSDPDSLALKITLTDSLPAGENEIIVSVSDRKQKENKLNLTFTVIESSGSEAEVIEGSFVTYPNPALPGETIFIRYSLTSGTNEVIINIYDVAGQLVKRFKREGQIDVNKIEWDGITEKGDKLSPGIYICELAVGKQHIYWRLAIRPGMRAR